MTDRAVVEKAAKRQGLVAVFRQGMDAGRGLLAHRFQQTRTDTAQTRVTEAAKIFLNHANRSPANPQGHRITVLTYGKVDSDL